MEKSFSCLKTLLRGSYCGSPVFDASENVENTLYEDSDETSCVSEETVVRHGSE